MTDTDQIDLENASKLELRAALKKAIENVEKLRDTVARVMRQPSTVSSNPELRTHPDDSAPAGWAERHGVKVPRADGVHESKEAWVRIKNGIIVGAGLKNQSILSLMMSMELLDQGAERHGSLYKDWRAAFLSRVDPSNSGGEGSDSVEAWTKEDCFSKLIHRIAKDYTEAMDCIVASKPKSKHLAAFQAKREDFVAAFRVVARAMSQIEKEAEEAKNKKSRHNA